MQTWMIAGAADPEPLEDAAQHLTRLFERCPDYAYEVSTFAMHACLIGRRKTGPDSLLSFVRVAKEALLLDAGTAGRAAVVLLCQAEAFYHAERRIEGLATLSEFNRTIQAADKNGLIYEWAISCGSHLTGLLWESGLERARAQAAFADAANRIHSIYADAALRREFTREWVEANFRWMSDTASLEGFADTGELELDRLYIESAVGAAINLAEQASEKVRAASESAVKALEVSGAPPDMLAMTLADVLAKADAGSVDALANRALEGLHRRMTEAASQRPPADLTDETARSLVEAALEARAEQLRQEWPAWQVAALLGRARSMRGAANVDVARRLYHEAVKVAIQSRLGLPQTAALGALLAFEAEQGRPVDAFTDGFLLAYGATAQMDPHVFESPRVRALLDDGIAAAASAAMERLHRSTDRVVRHRASMLIDLIRSPNAPEGDDILACVSGDSKGTEMARVPRELDVISRLERSLRTRASTAVLVTQALQRGTAFVLISAIQPPTFAFAPRGYADALASLEADAKGGLFAGLAGAVSTKVTERIRQAGSAAFASLPDEVKSAVRDHETILTVGDFRGAHPIPPYELLVADTRFLGTSKCIARFTSLHHLAEALERPSVKRERPRALITAAPNVPGYASLPVAASECEAVRSSLASSGYDAPVIESSRLDRRFYIDRLRHVDVLHVAAHGEAYADQEWLVLPGDERLTVDDLLSAPAGEMPFVFLNTCNLGRTRYLGAGISRGLAYTFVVRGAPAVVSNTSPVLDTETSKLAREFYRFALDAPVGEALRRARAASEASPMSWGSAALFGDPWHELPVPGSGKKARTDRRFS